MPELPEVETMRRGILGVVGAKVRDLVRPRCDCRPIQFVPTWASVRRRAKGKTVVAVDRLGKRVCIRLSGGENLILEPRMTGLVLTTDPPDVAHLRLQIDFDGGAIESVWFWDQRGLGLVKIFSDAELSEALGDDRLGADALAIDLETFVQRVRATRREIKPALLDQRLVAGVGNLYASEICHRAKVHPAARCDRLTVAALRTIHATMREVLLEAIEYEGSTLSDGTYRNALNQSGGYQNEHRVYDREGDVCRQCGRGKILRIVQAQRSTFYCPRCQKSPRNRPSQKRTKVEQ